MDEQADGKFRVASKCIGATYSCPKDQEVNPIDGAGGKEGLLQFWVDLGGEANPVEQYIVSVEKHQSGAKHYHLYVRFKNRFETTDVRKFDYAGVHPNILKGAIKQGWKDYVAKDGDFITNFYKKKVSKYSEALAAESLEEALTTLATFHPRDYLLSRDRMKRNLVDHFCATKPSRLKQYESWSEYGEYVKKMVLMSWETKAIILHGPTSLGKTALAKSLGTNPIMISHLDQLKTLPTSTTHLILDDMFFGHLPRTTVLHLMDLEEERHIHVRYATGVIPAGLPRIFTTNKMDFLGREGEELRQHDPAIERRLLWIDVENKLY